MGSANQKLLRASSIVALGTIVSRITGLFRNLIVVAVLGSALLGDTFNVANQMPNIIYNLIIGGSLTAVFVPQIVRALSRKQDQDKYLSSLVTLIIGSMALLTILSELLAPLLVRIFAASFVGHPEFRITLLFMRLCLPQLFFLTIYALLGQIANAQGKFAAMAWAPVINNLILILGFLLFKGVGKFNISNISDNEIFYLGLITTAGYLGQAFILLPTLWKDGIGIKPGIDFKNSELRKSFGLAGWTLIYAAISQISFLVVQNIATHAAEQSSKNGITTGVGITPYNNAFLIFILPQSVFVLSLTTALLPHISNLIHQNKLKETEREIQLTFKRAATVIIPSTVFLICFGVKIAQVLFLGIPLDSSKFIGLVLVGFAIGLPAYSYYTLGLRILNAFENVKLQVKGNLYMNILGTALALITLLFIPSEKETIGLAVVLSISYFYGCWFTFNQLKKFSIKISIKKILKFNYRSLIISLLAGIPALFMNWLIDKYLPITREFKGLISVGVCGVIFALIYIYLANVIRLGEVPNLSRLVIARLRKRESR